MTPTSAGDDINRTSGSTDRGAPTSDAGPISRTVIWGTNVNVQETQNKFSKFITEFIGDDNEGSDEPKYIRLMQEIKETARGFINIDCADLYAHDTVLYQQLIRYARVTTLSPHPHTPSKRCLLYFVFSSCFSSLPTRTYIDEDTYT